MTNEQIAALKAAANEVIGWSNCNAAWLDSSEDVPAAVVGHIDNDGNGYPVAVIDCEQYYSGDSLKLAKFYAQANSAAILELLDRLEAAERNAKRYLWLRNDNAYVPEAYAVRGGQRLDDLVDEFLGDLAPPAQQAVQQAPTTTEQRVLDVLVAKAVAAEREACANVCEAEREKMLDESAAKGLPFGEGVPYGDEAADRCAAAIRARDLI